MAIHFSEEELQSRRDNTCKKLQQAGLDGLLIFRQESMYYLTGYDTFGYCFFQCLYLGADGRFALLTRAPDLRQAQHTSDIQDIRVWVDKAGHNPAAQLRDMLTDFACKGQKLGIEYEAYGLTAANGKKVDAALNGFCTLEDASMLVSELRLIKSPSEIAYTRRAAELADDALDAALAISGAGADEGRILADMHSAVFSGGGDYSGNEYIIGSGPDALLCRYKSGRRTLDAQDQLTLEWAGAYRHYHAAMMRTVIIGAANQEHQHMHKVAVEAMHACTASLKPGDPIGNVFDAHARVADANNLREHRMNACGYSMGTTFTPTWMDWPMFYTGNPVIAQADMVFFLHMIFVNSHSGNAMTLGHSVRVTDSGCELLSRQPLDLLVR